jgi:hypothetical protein
VARKHLAAAAFALLLLGTPASLSYAQSSYLWRAATGGQIRSRPAIGPDGTTYALSEDSYLYAWVNGGSLAWKHELGWLPWDCLAVSPDGTIYAGLKNDDFIAVNPHGGRLWTVRLDGLPAGDPAIGQDGTVLVGTDAGTLSAFSHLGRREWFVTLPGAVTQSPVIDGAGTIYVVAADRRLYALAPWGDFKWSLPFSTAPGAPAIGADGTVVLGTEDGTLSAVSPRGDLLWQKALGGRIAGVSAAVDHVVAATAAGPVVSFSMAGTEIGRWDSARMIAAAPLVDQAGTLLTALDGTIVAGDTAHGIASTFRTGAQGASLLAASGAILLGGRDWVVYAVDRTALGLGPVGSANPAPWPQQGHDEMHTGRTDAAPAAGNGGLLDLNPDYLYLQGLSGAAGRDGTQLLLTELGTRIADRTLGKSTWYAVRMLEGVVGQGLLTQVRQNQKLINDFPDLRASAAGLLARVGSTASRAALLDAVNAEPDGVALAAEIRALGAIASDGDGASARTVARAWTRRAAFSADPRLAAAVVDALGRITAYEGGLGEPSAVLALIAIARGSDGEAIRAAALSVLQGDAKVDILDQEE